VGSFSFSEILTILVVILIVFGPNRLPELARKLGKLITQARAALSSFTDQLESEYGDAAQPLRELKDQYDGVKKDLTNAVTSMGSLDPTAPPQDPPTAKEDETGDQSEADPPPPPDGEDGEATPQPPEDDANPEAVA